ncbi:MAG: hypothetical protein E7211_21345 [Clostridium lundense]|nr:hypothetical protein [Clostridium lundense]
MTLGDGKRRVLMLLDEYSSGGVLTADRDIDARMNDFFDIAQRDMAQWQPILRRATVTLDGTGRQALPQDVAQVRSIRRDNGRARDCEIIDGALVYPAGDTSALTLDYVARPAAITPDTADTHVFEVSEEAAGCLPFFVAAQQLIPDLVVDYGAFYDLYLKLRNLLPRDTSAPSTGGMRQALWRG